jgi:WD40 repeat protein
MAWCPWQNRLLATGGGSNDRSIKLWNMNVGECVDTIDTKSQVSGIFWNTEYQEIISAHGFPNHTLQIWKYPTKAKVCSFCFDFLLWLTPLTILFCNRLQN